MIGKWIDVFGNVIPMYESEEKNELFLPSPYVSTFAIIQRVE